MSELKSVSDIFQKNIFRIPDYQRGYAWQKQQLVDFWDDLINLHEDKYHYTGLLSIKPLPKSETSKWTNENWLIKKGFSAYHVVDGQQRLTTISILINEIVDFVPKIKEAGEDQSIVFADEYLCDIRHNYVFKKRPPENITTTYLFGYERDNPSSEYLRYCIFGENYSGTVIETYYTKNLKYAKEFFKEKLEELDNRSGFKGIESLYQKLTNQLMFNIHTIEDDYDVFVAFETMNNRGKKLTNLELLKNRLIYLTTLYDDKVIDSDDKEELRKSINDTWKDIYFQLGRNSDKPLSDDEFLRAHWILYFKYTRIKGTDYINYLLNKFSHKNIFNKSFVSNECELGDEFEEDDSLPEDDSEDDTLSVEEIDEDRLEPNEIKKYVDSLKECAKYWYYTFFPEENSEFTDEEKLWLGRLNRIGIGYFRPLVVATLVLAVVSSNEQRIELYKAIEAFIFIGFRMAMYQSSYKSSYYNRMARELYFGRCKIEEITCDIINTNTMNMEEAKQSFISKMKRRFTSSGTGFYAWRDLRYFLYEYEYELAIKRNIDKINWGMFTKAEKDKVTIEHILPQTATRWYWKNQFRDYSKEEIRILANSIGNLLPLSQSINSSLQNISFNEKKVSGSNIRRGYSDGSHSEIEVSKYEDWNAGTILERGLHLLEFMENRWGIKFADKEEKIKLLNLEFVNDNRVKSNEIPKPNEGEGSIDVLSTSKELQLKYWEGFVDYCNKNDRSDLISRKPQADNWYDHPAAGKDYHFILQALLDSKIRVGIYIYDSSAFKRIESKKTEIEEYCGFKMNWYSSKEKSVAKRVIYTGNGDIRDSATYQDSYKWQIEHLDKLKQALEVYDV